MCIVSILFNLHHHFIQTLNPIQGHGRTVEAKHFNHLFLITSSSFSSCQETVSLHLVRSLQSQQSLQNKQKSSLVVFLMNINESGTCTTIIIYLFYNQLYITIVSGQQKVKGEDADRVVRVLACYPHVCVYFSYSGFLSQSQKNSKVDNFVSQSVF